MKRPSLKMAGLSAVAAAVSLALGIWVGPHGVYAASVCGILFALAALWRVNKQPIAFILLGFHGLLIIAGASLDLLFLRPLAEDALKIPRLSQVFRHSHGLFEIRAPQDWVAEEVNMPTEIGVRFRPADRVHYMGVSELTVRVRELENPTSDPIKFLTKMAEAISLKPKNNRTLFEFSTSRASLLGDEKGMWSHLVVKRFWVPLYQVALYGLKGKRYLCTVSATGIKNHDTLSEILCLGVFHTISIRAKDQ